MTKELAYGNTGMMEMKNIIENLSFTPKEITIYDIESKESMFLQCEKEDIVQAICMICAKEKDSPRYIEVKDDNTVVIAIRFNTRIFSTESTYHYAYRRFHQIFMDEDDE